MSYIPYLMLSSDSETTPSLINAAEADGSIVAYRYQRDQKQWAPMAFDNPDLINANDGAPGPSNNLFNNVITLSDDGTTYTLHASDGSTRVFKMKSFPTVGSNSIERKRPLLRPYERPIPQPRPPRP